MYHCAEIDLVQTLTMTESEQAQRPQDCILNNDKHCGFARAFDFILVHFTDIPVISTTRHDMTCFAVVQVDQTRSTPG